MRLRICGFGTRRFPPVGFSESRRAGRAKSKKFWKKYRRSRAKAFFCRWRRAEFLGRLSTSIIWKLENGSPIRVGGDERRGGVREKKSLAPRKIDPYKVGDYDRDAAVAGVACGRVGHERISAKYFTRNFQLLPGWWFGAVLAGCLPVGIEQRLREIGNTTRRWDFGGEKSAAICVAGARWLFAGSARIVRNGGAGAVRGGSCFNGLKTCGWPRCRWETSFWLTPALSLASLRPGRPPKMGG